MKQQIKAMLPTALIAAIDQLELSRIMRGKCYKLSNILLYKTLVMAKDIDCKVVLSSAYMEKVFDKSYHKFFKRMNEEDILLSDNFYTKGKAKNYRINPEYINDEFAEVVYDEIVEKVNGRNIGTSNKHDEFSTNEPGDSNNNLSPGVPPISSHSHFPISYSILSSYSFSHSTSNTPSPYIPRVFEDFCVHDDLESLKYDISKLKAATRHAVANIIPRNFRINDQIKSKSFKVINRLTETSYYTNREKATNWCKKHECDLIENGGKYYIDKLDEYIKSKKCSKTCSYHWQISKLTQKHFYANRNPTNYRLDHNLTSTPKTLLEVIKQDNDLVEIDIKNSQFTFHAYWMKENGWLQYEDVCTYYDLAIEGNIYEELAGTFNVTRDKAKELMMELAFSSHKHSSTLKKQFRGVFPNVLRHIEEYKSNAESSKLFSIELQKRESELIIDHIYPRIKSEGIFCLTRHDSLLVRRDEFDVALRILKECCNEKEFECTVKADGESMIIGESQMDNEENILAWLDEHEARQNQIRKEKEFYKQLYPNKLI